MRKLALFIVAFVLGISLQVTVIHSLFPSTFVPDFLVILVVFLALSHRTPLALLGAFLLGLGGDFASARFLGPNAAGCVIAFCFAVAFLNRVYAERGASLLLLTFLASLLKSLTTLAMLALYTPAEVFSVAVAQSVFIEAAVTGILAPLFAKVVAGRWRQEGYTSASPSLLR